MNDLVIDGETKILSLADIKVGRKPGPRGGGGGGPVDFARDSILIVDPATRRPIAACRPIGMAAKPRPVTAPVAPSAVVPPTAQSDVEDPTSRNGQLSPAHRERLERLWMEYPAWGAGRIAVEFERVTGRAISDPTAAKYRPLSPGPTAKDPKPEEIEAAKQAVKGKR